MGAKVVAFTQPINKEYGTTIKEFIAYVARVSNPSNQQNFETSDKLLEYLRKNNHWSPFEMADIIVEINTTRDIVRQLLRHRSFSFQEFSQRYAEVSSFSEPKEARLQDSKNRQNSLETHDEDLESWWKEQQESLMAISDQIYGSALGRGIAKEVARVVLPEGLTNSRLYMKGSVRSWMHYFEVRLDKSTQKEHRELAEDIWNSMKGLYD